MNNWFVLFDPGRTVVRIPRSLPAKCQCNFSRSVQTALYHCLKDARLRFIACNMHARWQARRASVRRRFPYHDQRHPETECICWISVRLPAVWRTHDHLSEIEGQRYGYALNLWRVTGRGVSSLYRSSNSARRLSLCWIYVINGLL